MMRRKSPPSEKIYLKENHCQINIYKGRGGKDKIVLCIHVTMYDINKIFYIIYSLVIAVI